MSRKIVVKLESGEVVFDRFFKDPFDGGLLYMRIFRDIFIRDDIVVDTISEKSEYETLTYIISRLPNRFSDSGPFGQTLDFKELYGHLVTFSSWK